MLWTECTRQKSPGLRRPVCTWFTKRALPELIAELLVAKVHPHGSFWALETITTKSQSPYSSKWSPHLNALFLAGKRVIGHLIAFQPYRCLLKKASIIIYPYLQYHLSTSYLKYLYSGFHTIGELFMILFIEKQYHLLKALSSFPWWFAGHCTIQIKISLSSKALLWAIGEHLPGSVWVP